MAAYNFQLNPRLSLKLQATPGNPAITTVSGMSPSVIRPPVPTSASAGHLMAMHPMMGSTRPILITPQGFPVSASHIFGERMFSPATIAPVLSSGLNDVPLEFNVVRQNSIENDSIRQEKLQSHNVSIDNQDSPNISGHAKIEEKKVLPEKFSFNEENDKNNEAVSIEVDDSDCQIIGTDLFNESDRINKNAQLITTNSVPTKNVPTVSNNPGVWNSNINFPILGVNQMLNSSTIDPYLFVGQTLGVYSNALSHLSNNGVPAEDPNVECKTIIHHKSCTLFPPNINAPLPTTRERPQGCKTVFVGGLPENMKEEVIREVFAFCGEITNLRLSTKKFCHIRFSEEIAVDRALTLSGYRVRLGVLSDLPNTGRLHVDFAHARDDQFEWECKQRQIQREQRHRERIRRESIRDSSPSNPSHFTESEANSVLEKLKGEDTFLKAISIAACWLDRGECNKRNVNTFYGMIQSVNSHVRRLLYEKNLCENEYKKAKDSLKSRAQTILSQFAQIEKLFISSLHKKVWDHFTKAQRKNIEVWKKTALEIKTLPSEIQESINDDEMDVSDSDSDDVSLYKKRKLDVHETNSLKDENDSLRCQLEAYKNEICVVRSELHCEISRKTEQVTILQKTLNSLSQEMDKLKKQRIPTPELPANFKSNEKEAQEADTTVIPWTSSLTSLVEREAKLLGLISVFLQVHPFGAGVEYICSFLQKTIPTLKVTEIEHTMCRFPSVFRQEVVGIGANMERRWKFVGFNVESDNSLAQS